MDAGGVPVIAELRSRMATIAGNGDGAESGAVPDSKEPPSPDGPRDPARASPPVSAAALMVADELLGARGVSPGAGAHTEGTDAGPSSVRRLSEEVLRDSRPGRGVLVLAGEVAGAQVPLAV